MKTNQNIAKTCKYPSNPFSIFSTNLMIVVNFSCIRGDRLLRLRDRSLLLDVRDPDTSFNLTPYKWNWWCLPWVTELVVFVDPFRHLEFVCPTCGFFVFCLVILPLKVSVGRHRCFQRMKFESFKWLLFSGSPLIGIHRDHLGSHSTSVLSTELPQFGQSANGSEFATPSNQEIDSLQATAWEQNSTIATTLSRTHHMTTPSVDLTNAHSHSGIRKCWIAIG